MKKIKIFNGNQFSTKTHKLKKNAQAEVSLTIGGDNENQGQENSNEYIAERIKSAGYHSFTSPYIFTHIQGRNVQNEQVFIFESVVIGSDRKEITTTPQTLFKLLTA